MYKELGISEKVLEMANEVEKEIEHIFEKLEENCLKSSMKVLKAFQDNKVSTTDFNEITGYGYYDAGREKLEKIYADIPDCQRISDNYSELLEAIDLGRVQITDIMRRLNELEKEMGQYEIPKPESEREHVITLNNDDLQALAEKCGISSFETDKNIETAIRKLIHE